MTTHPARRGWSYAEFARLPDDGNRSEVIDGELFVTPSPRPLHQELVGQLVELLGPFVRGHGIGRVYPGPVDVLLGRWAGIAAAADGFSRACHERMVRSRRRCAGPTLGYARPSAGGPASLTVRRSAAALICGRLPISRKASSMKEQVRPVTRAVAVVLVMAMLAGFLFVLAIGEVPRRPDWGEALGLLIVLPTLIYVAIIGQTPRWIQRLEKAR